ncbi:anthranilate synthase component I family protein [uncultured Paenibacillus sp.]|uniref:anthranilate synthase component I family protein n=1 Tax=uncultured Paenibacillus sp. TaxID=227322 RepID=UPI0028D7B111|nr:anthranilate synthase component I family protein [uncultured Paenibacillus sp.]
METTSLAQWTAWRREGCTTLPLLRRIPLAENGDRLRTWTGAWKAASEHAIVLESGKDGRYTYLGLRPSAVIRGYSRHAEIMQAGAADARVIHGKPLEVVREHMRSRKGPRVGGGPKWTGGLAGFWSYDIIRSIERLPELAADDLGLPDYLFLQFDELWIIDHVERALYCSVHTAIDGAPSHTAGDSWLETAYEYAVRKLEEMAALWERIVSDAASTEEAARETARRKLLSSDSMHIDIEAMQGLASPFPKGDYMNAVSRIRGYIGQGDVFQVNLSLRQSKATDAEPDELYEWLRLVNPSPYMGFLRCPDFSLVSASPELLVELRAGRLSTRPIAGTRRRGRTPEEDGHMAEELRSNEKERAEHIMLVDLERNDLGRISAYGTVKVRDFMVIEYYSHVMHLVSQVEGELASGKDAFDVIAATFPGGTITGAPKIRTMEIIEELEPTRRGPYTGSLGWIDYDGDMEFNIIIRTMIVKDGLAHIQAGAGIVIDSEPEREYYESLNKAKALWKAVQYCEEGGALP